MSLVHSPSAARSKTNRSAVSNGSRLLEGVDGRSATGRRYRDLTMSLADDLGGASKLTTSQEAMIRQLAGVIIESEKLQAQIVTGEAAVDHEQLVRLTNTQTRLIRALGLGDRREAEKLPSLADHLASRATAA